MGKINLDHFLITNAAANHGKNGLRSVRYFIFEKTSKPSAPPASSSLGGASFFGFIIFPTNFAGIGLLDKLIDELKKFLLRNRAGIF